MAEAPVAHEAPAPKMSVAVLAAMVVGSMVGAGVFNLPGRFATATGVLGGLTAWIIAGAGMLMLALVFQSLAIRKPDLDAGVFAYAKAGFGEYLGFFSAFGYWASACVGNAFYWILISSTLGGTLTIFGHGDTLAALVLSSIAVWVYFLLVRRGVKDAALINRIVTIAKMVPILMFIVLCLFAFKPAVFADNLTAAAYGSLFDQVKATMLVTVFVFLGIEGASTYSRHAEKREDVGRATVLGFLSVLAIFASVTIVSYGVLPYQQIAALRQPSTAGVLEAAFGSWGGAFVSIGLIVSVLGAYLAWTLMSSEVLYMAAKTGDMPRFLARVSPAGVPTAALVMTTVVIQVILVGVMFVSNALDFALDLTAALSLIPYLFVAAYAVKLAWTRETYAPNAGIRRDLIVAGLATVYTIFLVYAAGLKFLLLSFIVYAPATILFVMARREQGRRLFSPVELVILAITVVGAVAGIAALATGAVTL